MSQAIRWGAKSVLGIEGEKSVLPVNAILADLDQFNFGLIADFDVVLLLSVIKYVKDPERLIKNAENKCKKIMYFEGHQQQYEKDNFNELIYDTQFVWKKLGETPMARPFYRGVRKV